MLSVWRTEAGRDDGRLMHPGGGVGGRSRQGCIGGSKTESVKVLKEACWRGSLAISWCSWSNTGKEVGVSGAFLCSASSTGQRLS